MQKYNSNSLYKNVDMRRESYVKLRMHCNLYAVMNNTQLATADYQTVYKIVLPQLR